jgi:hypothetical protein
MDCDGSGVDDSRMTDDTMNDTPRMGDRSGVDDTLLNDTMNDSMVAAAGGVRMGVYTYHYATIPCHTTVLHTVLPYHSPTYCTTIIILIHPCAIHNILLCITHRCSRSLR